MKTAFKISFSLLALLAGLYAFAQGSVSLRVQVMSSDRSFLTTRALVKLHDSQRMYDKWETTDGQGVVNFLGLPTGDYEIEVSAAGYRSNIIRRNFQSAGDVMRENVMVLLEPDANGAADAPPAINGLPGAAQDEAQRGTLALQLGKLKEAEKRFRKAQKLVPDNAELNYLLGSTLSQLKRQSDAKPFLERSVELNPKYAPALIALAGVYIGQNQPAAAIKPLESAIELSPRQWRPHWLLANAHLALGALDPAREHAELAISLSKDSVPAAKLVLGEALAGLGRYSDSVAALESYLQQVPNGSDTTAVKQVIASLNARMQGGEGVPVKASGIGTLARSNTPSMNAWTNSAKPRVAKPASTSTWWPSSGRAPTGSSSRNSAASYPDWETSPTRSPPRACSAWHSSSIPSCRIPTAWTAKVSANGRASLHGWCTSASFPTSPSASSHSSSGWTYIPSA